MTNERYLIVSYFVCAALSIALAYWRISIFGAPSPAGGRGAGQEPSTHAEAAVPLWICASGPAGFVTVSYRSCDRTTYTEIVASRGYLIEKNQEQISSILLYILAAVVFWNLVASASS